MESEVPFPFIAEMAAIRNPMTVINATMMRLRVTAHLVTLAAEAQCRCFVEAFKISALRLSIKRDFQVASRGSTVVTNFSASSRVIKQRPSEDLSETVKKLSIASPNVINGFPESLSATMSMRMILIEFATMTVMIMGMLPLKLQLCGVRCARQWSTVWFHGFQLSMMAST